MPNFLKLCQDVARESGVIPNLPAPASVAGQSGKLARIVAWVDTAYRHIQNSEEEWKWLYSEFDQPLIASLAQYSGSDLGLPRWARWHGLGEEYAVAWTIRAAGATRDTEQRLMIVSTDYYDRILNVGKVQTGRPTMVTIDSNDRLVVYPTPDAAYTIRGSYYKSAQELTADGDLPEMPQRFHDAIVWKALMYLATFDESMNQIPNWNAFYGEVMGQLRSSQLPQFTIGEALA